jgi:hypothetical protein
MPVPQQVAGAAIDSPDAWARLLGWLPLMPGELLSSEVFDIERRPPIDSRGIYLFSERGRHMYVGRTGVTARSRAKGDQPITSFRHRFDQHTQLGRPPGAASFANRLMRQAATRSKITIPAGWWDARRSEDGEACQLFRASKQRIATMECRVVAFDDDLRGVHSTIAEVYVHTHLRTPFNDFSTS